MSKRRRISLATARLAEKGKVKLSTSPLDKVYRDIKQVFAMETSRDTTFKAGKSKLRRLDLHLADPVMEKAESDEVNKEYLNIRII